MPKMKTQKSPLKWIAASLLIILALGLIFKLFEPVFVYKSGWAPLPQSSHPPTITELHDETWHDAGLLADKQLRSSYETLDTPALSAAISIDGRLVWSSAIGYADIESETPVSAKSQFRLGSTSKAITAVAIGTLMDKDQIELETTLGSLDPSLKSHLRPLTLGEVMSHRAGIRNYGTCFCFPVWEHQNRKKFASVRESLSVIESDALIHKPSERYAYTSLGYNLAGLAAEKASSLSFEQLLSQNVFAPLAMDHSDIEVSDRDYLSRVSFYQVEAGQYKPEFWVDNSIRWPSGGLLSTPSDMVSLGAVMLNEQFLSRAARGQLLSIPEQGRENGGEIYAHGWRVSDWRIDDNTVLKSYNHNGVAVGSTSIFAVFPEHDIIVSVMMNKSANGIGDLTDVANAIVAPFINR